MGIFLIIIGLILAGASVAVLTLASGGPFPSESIASFVALAIGGIYVILGIAHLKAKLVAKFVRVGRTPFWLYIVGLLFVFALVYWFLGGISFFSVIAGVIGLIVTIIVGGIYAIWALADRITKCNTRTPFWFYISTLLPVLVLTYFLFGALWR